MLAESLVSSPEGYEVEYNLTTERHRQQLLNFVANGADYERIQEATLPVRVLARKSPSGARPILLGHLIIEKAV